MSKETQFVYYSGRCLSQGDILCNEDTGSVYIFKRWDTLGRMVAWDTQGGIKVFGSIPKNLWRYDREDLISDLPNNGKV